MKILVNTSIILSAVFSLSVAAHAASLGVGADLGKTAQGFCPSSSSQAGEQCVIQVKDLPMCANAVYGICERKAHAICGKIKNDAKYRACSDREQAKCAATYDCK